MNQKLIFIYLADGWPNTDFWLENKDGVLEGVLFMAKGLAAGAKLFVGWDGLHACCPKRDMLPNADPGELKPKVGWPNVDGWLAAAATDPNNPLDAAVVEGEPKIDDVVLVTDGVPKIDEVVVGAEPNIEWDGVELVGLPNIDEFVEAEDPNAVVVWVEDPKLPVVIVVGAEPNIDSVVVEEGEPNIDEVVFIEFPNIDEEVVVTEEPKIEDTVVVLVAVPKIDDVVVAFAGVPKNDDALVVLVVEPNIEEALVVLAEVLKTEGALVVLVEVLKIDGELVALVGVLKIEVLFVFEGELKIEGLAVLVRVLKIDVCSVVVVVEFPKMLVLDEFMGVPKIEVLVDGISKTEALLVVVGVLGAFSLSGVTGSEMIGVGLSETWEVDSVTLLVAVGARLKTFVILTLSNDEDTGEELTGSLLAGSEKLNDVVTVVDVGLKIDLVSDAVVFAILFWGAEKLNVENAAVSGLELKLKFANVASFGKTVSCLFFDSFSALNPENMLGVSIGLDVVFGVSKLKVANEISFGLSILFLMESAKLKVVVILVFGTVATVFTLDTLEKLKGVFSFESVVPEIISKVDFVDTLLRLLLLKFKGVAIEVFRLKSTGSLLESLGLFPNKGILLAELKTTGSLIKPLKSNLFEKSLGKSGLGVEVLFIGFQTGVLIAFKGKPDPDEYAVAVAVAVSEVDVSAFDCWVVGINKGFLNCIKSGLKDNGTLDSVTFCCWSFKPLFFSTNKGVWGREDTTFSFVTIGVKSTLFSWTFCLDNGFKGVLHTGLPRSIFAYLDLVIFVRLVLKSFNHSWSLLTLESESALWFADNTEYFLATLYELIADTPSLSNVIFNNCSDSFDKPTSLWNKTTIFNEKYHIFHFKKHINLLTKTHLIWKYFEQNQVQETTF